MDPVAEFRLRALRVIRRGLFTVLATIATVMLFAATTVHLADPYQVYDPVGGILHVWATVAAALLTLVFEVLWRHSRHPITRCPHCRRPLTDYAPVVVASGCCYSCGRRVLERPADPPADALIPRAEFLAADTTYQAKAVPLLVGGVMASYAGGCGALAVVNRLNLPEPLPAVLFVALVAVAPVSVAVVLKWLAAAGKRNPALACPGCGRLLAGARMLTAATGHCTACGCRAIVPRTRPLAPPHLGPMWTVAGLTQRVSERRRRYWWYIKKRPLVWITPLVGGYLSAWGYFGVVSTSQVAQNWFGFPSERSIQSWSIGVGTSVLAACAYVAVWWVIRAAHHRHPLDCPRCGREMLVPFARATGCCHQCGRPVVEPAGVG